MTPEADPESLVGRRLGGYEFLSLIDTGGMGQVYRARDLTLPRDVAVKVVSPEFTHDPVRRARFRKEADVLAAFAHPHIAHIYAFVEAEGRSLLAMELVPGQSLAERIMRGPLRLEEALDIASQVADALDAAHEQGVIHRDLKPANIRITPAGVVKVLDFGLATTVGPSLAETGTTITRTAPGTLLGTVAYMSPEQARGEHVDKRTDIWAFGCVLFEMLTGVRLFGKASAAETLALLMTQEIEWSSLPTHVPTAVRTLLKRCLERDRRKRLGDVAAIRFVLEDVSDLNVSSAKAMTAGEARLPPRARWIKAVVLPAAALIAGATIVGGYVWARQTPAAARVARLSIPQSGVSVLTDSTTIDVFSATPDLTLTPDGSQLVYVGNNGTQLFVRPFNSLDGRVVASGIQLRNPFMSPNGDWVGYADKRFILRKVPITGGPSVPLPASLDTDLAGATWLPDDTIVFATFGQVLGLRRTSAAAGTPKGENETLTKLNHEKGELSHLWPEALPGGHAVLFTIAFKVGGLNASQVWVYDLRTRLQKLLVAGGSCARFIPSAADGLSATRGHLVYAAEGGLRAIPFDTGSLSTSGTAVPVVNQVSTSARGAANFAVAADGTLVYVNTANPVQTTLMWVDREQREEPITAPSHRYTWVRVAPDGTRLALATGDPGLDIAVLDIRRATLTPLRFAATEFNNGPVWSFDGRRILFQARVPNGPSNVWWVAADGSDTATRLTTTASNPQRPTGVSPDGSSAVLMEARPSLDVMQVALDATRRVTSLLTAAESYEAGGVVSPNGRWLAYESDVSGPMEVYVCPYPNVAGACVQVSTAGGRAPRWLPKTGGELFFVGPNGALMRVPVENAGPAWRAGKPSTLLDRVDLDGTGSAYGSYDVAPDGRIVVIKSVTTPPQISIVLRWNQELARLAPPR